MSAAELRLVLPRQWVVTPTAADPLIAQELGSIVSSEVLATIETLPHAISASLLCGLEDNRGELSELVLVTLFAFCVSSPNALGENNTVRRGRLRDVPLGSGSSGEFVQWRAHLRDDDLGADAFVIISTPNLALADDLEPALFDILDTAQIVAGTSA